VIGVVIHGSMSRSPEKSPLYLRLAAYADSRWALIIAFCWGIAEATFFFIIPDVWLGFIALFHWQRGIRSTAAAVMGALLGGGIMYALALGNPADMNLFLTRIPLIHPGMLESISTELRIHGLIAMINGPLRGIPYKVYAVQVGEQSFPIIPFLLMTLVARLERFLPAVLAASFIGGWCKDVIRRRTIFVVVLYILLWMGIYFLYYLRFR
jgi:membrane protein YqaA with SNARE-associated domain